MHLLKIERKKQMLNQVQHDTFVWPSVIPNLFRDLVFV